MKLRHLTLILALLAISLESAYAQILPSPKEKQALPSGICYMNLKTDGLPATASKEAQEAFKARKKVEAGDYPYTVQMYDYLDYAWTPDDVEESYDEDDEVLWNLPNFDFYNFHKPEYGMGCGAFIENGKMHTFVSDFTYGALLGIYRFEMVTYNADNMQVISRKSFGTTKNDMDYLCLAQCQYPLDEKKGIGIFYNMETGGEDWVIMDFDNQTLERKATCDKNYGIIVTDGTYLYGWCENNCIYKIDPQTFTSTKVGAHGFKQYIDQGNGTMGAYVQSATYDKNTKTCYWGAFSAKTGESGFYKVNLETAKIEKVLDTYVTQHLGICTNPETVEDDAPGPVTDFALQFEDASHKGTATFTMPTLNYKGDKSLEGTLSYKITQGSTTLAEGEGLNPGDAVTANLSLKKDGNYIFSLQTQNSVGWSKSAQIRQYIGYDIPETPVSATATIAKDGTVNLHWTAPTKGTHNGYIGNLVYDIYRMHGTEMTPVALALADTTYTEQLPVGAITTYTYIVVADNNGHQSDYCYSNAAACGKAYECPMVIDFSSQDIFNMFLVCDANGDGCTWSWDADRDYLGYAKCMDYNSELSSDDWLFSPSVNLEAGRTYKLTYTARCVTMDLPERISIGVGKEQTPEAMTLIENRRDVPAVKRPREITFTVPEDGEYYLGFQSCSDPDQLNLMISGFRLDAEPADDAPAAVNDFSCEAGDKGATDATIKFTAPTTTAGGAQLSAISKITVERDLNVVKTWENVTPGEALEYYDNVGTEGYHDWVVTTFSDEKRGDYKEQKLYLGLDVPAVPKGGYIKDLKDSLDICWEPVTTGAHGGYIDPEDVTYMVRNYYHQELGTTKDTHFVVKCNDIDQTLTRENTDTEDLEITYYRLSCSNSKGAAANNSDFVTTSDTEYLLEGEIFDLPFEDSAPNGRSMEPWWMWDGDDTNYTMGIGTGAASDGDNGCFGWWCYTAGDNFHMRTAKLNFTQVKNPKLEFDIAAMSQDFKIYVNAITAEHEYINIADIDFADIEVGYWGRISAEIPMDVADSRYDVIDFHFSGSKDDSWLYFDNVKIYDDDEEAGIEDVDYSKSGAGVAASGIYDLSGRRITNISDAHKHGIYIINGRKVVR